MCSIMIGTIRDTMLAINDAFNKKSERHEMVIQLSSFPFRIGLELWIILDLIKGDIHICRQYLILGGVAVCIWLIIEAVIISLVNKRYK